MTTNFFQTIEKYLIDETVLSINLVKNGDKISASILQRSKVDDKAVKNIIPLILTGTSEELDSGFFDSIDKPMSETKELITNISEYEAGKKKADSEKEFAKAEKDKAEKERESNYKTHKDKADKLLNSKNYSEADKEYRIALDNALSKDKKAIEDILESIKSNVTPDLFDLYSSEPMDISEKRIVDQNPTEEYPEDIIDNEEEDNIDDEENNEEENEEIF